MSKRDFKYIKVAEIQCKYVAITFRLLLILQIAALVSTLVKKYVFSSVFNSL